MKSIRLGKGVEQENYANATLESRKIINAEAEAIHMILNGIGDDIYLTVDSYSTARKMWLAIEHLQQEESINKQDGFGHFAKECRKPKQAKDYKYHKRKPKRAKDYVYHKEKMMLCKQEEKGVPLSAEQDTYVVETVDSNVTPDSSDKCDNDAQADQNAKEPEDERVLLASLIANFKLVLDENKKSQRKLKKANTSITQELQKSKQDLAKTKQDLEKSKQDLETSKQDLESSKQNLTYYKSELEKYKSSKQIIKTKRKLNLNVKNSWFIRTNKTTASYES
ncbi:hypothetical protein Tco_0719567 [Tanacetum coccineum]